MAGVRGCHDLGVLPVALARVVGVFAAATLGLLPAAVWLAQRGG